MHRPVCVRCKVELRPKKNGVGCVDFTNYNGILEPCALYDADLWECPICHYQIVTGFGHSPLASRGNAEFAKFIRAYRERSHVIWNVNYVEKLTFIPEENHAEK